MITNEADRTILRKQRLRLGITGQGVEENAEILLQRYWQFENRKRQIRRASFQIAECWMLLRWIFRRFYTENNNSINQKGCASGRESVVTARFLR